MVVQHYICWVLYDKMILRVLDTTNHHLQASSSVARKEEEKEERDPMEGFEVSSFYGILCGQSGSREILKGFAKGVLADG